MGQLHDDRRSSPRQGSSRGPRRRRCLLKGCEQFFKPEYAQSRYCSAACQDAADRWRHWHANQTWRKTERGCECRRQQSCRYRERVRQRREAEQAALEQAAEARREGSAPSRCFGKNLLWATWLLRVVYSLATLAASAVLLLLVPQGFTASDPTRETVGTAAETGAVESPPDSAVAQESTSPHIVGPWQAGLLWFSVALKSAAISSRGMMSGARATVAGR